MGFDDRIASTLTDLLAAMSADDQVVIRQAGRDAIYVYRRRAPEAGFVAELDGLAIALHLLRENLADQREVDACVERIARASEDQS